MTSEDHAGQLRRFLIVLDPDGMAADLVPLLQARGEVHLARSREEALAALRDAQYDAVLAAGSELLPLTHAARRERAETVFEGIGQGACIVSRDGKLIWANATLRSYPPEVVEAIRAAAVSMLLELVEAPASATRVRQRSLRVGHHYFFDLSVSVFPRADKGIEEAIGLFSDTSAASRLRENLEMMDAAGRELVALDVDAAALDVGERLQLLEEKLISVCRDLLHFTHFNVLVLDPKTNRLQTVLAGGFSEQAKAIEVYAREEGNGISGYVAATGKSYICFDISKDPLYLPGLECASSSLTVPLRLIGRIVGVLNVESDQLAAFTDEDRQVAEILGRYIAVALHMLKLLAVERSEATGQVTADVASELTDPLNTIVAEASRLLEEVQADQARQRLRTITAQVDRAKQILRAKGEVPGIRGLVPQTTSIDPRLEGRRVLVADDEDIIRETIADVLTKGGALVDTARDGDEAVAMLRSQLFDLVLSDIKMPNKNGYEVFAAAKQANPACPVILITGFGYDPEHSIVRASKEGLAAVLFKPFKVEQLMDNIYKALAPSAPQT